MQGASPLASPGLSRRRHLQTLPKQKPCGGLAPGRRGGRGRTTHPAGGRGGRLPAASAIPAPCGGLAFLLARLPCLSRCFCPLSPRPPSPVGKGETFTLFRRGLRPRHPGIKTPAALTDLAKQVPCAWEPAVRCKTDRTAVLLAVPVAKERGDRGRWNYPSQATAAFEMVLSPGAGRASAARGQAPPPAQSTGGGGSADHKKLSPAGASDARQAQPGEQATQATQAEHCRQAPSGIRHRTP